MAETLQVVVDLMKPVEICPNYLTLKIVTEPVKTASLVPRPTSDSDQPFRVGVSKIRSGCTVGCGRS